MINHIKQFKIFQAKKPNRAALRKLKRLGYPLANIRKALVQLNGLKLSDISENQVAPSNISRTLSGIQNSQTAKELISSKLNLDIEELF